MRGCLVVKGAVCGRVRMARARRVASRSHWSTVHARRAPARARPTRRTLAVLDAQRKVARRVRHLLHSRRAARAHGRVCKDLVIVRAEEAHRRVGAARHDLDAHDGDLVLPVRRLVPLRGRARRDLVDEGLGDGEGHVPLLRHIARAGN